MIDLCFIIFSHNHSPYLQFCVIHQKEPIISFVYKMYTFVFFEYNNYSLFNNYFS